MERTDSTHDEPAEAAGINSPEATVPGAGKRPARRGMLPGRGKRLTIESVFMRVVATLGIVAIGVALGAILVSSDVAGWITGLAVAAESVVLSALLWSSREL